MELKTIHPKRISVKFLKLPLKQPLISSKNKLSTKNSVLLEMETNNSIGYGECLALNFPIYNQETPESCYKVLSSLIPSLIGQPLNLYNIGDYINDSEPFSRSCLEMAYLDCSLKESSVSLKNYLGISSQQVPSGCVISLGSNKEEIHNKINQGYKRIKIKISPRTNMDLLYDVINESKVIIDLDANASFEEPELLNHLSKTNVRVFEQPFKIDDIKNNKKFLKQLKSRQFLALDESANNLNEIKLINKNKSANSIVIKPAKYGGIINALDIYNYCLKNDLAPIIGGLLETGLGRRVLATFASLDGFIPGGDLTPANYWFSDQPWEDIDMEDGQISVPNNHGISSTLNEQVLKKLCVDTYETHQS